MLYNKYFYNIVKNKKYKWFFVLDLDEFLYSPFTTNLKEILKNYENYSQINIGMHNFGSSNFIIQPDNVVQNFVYRSKYDESKPYISHKSGFKSNEFINFGIHSHSVNGKSKFVNQNGSSDLVINHYAIQSLEYFKNKKLIIGDVNNFYTNEYVIF